MEIRINRFELDLYLTSGFIHVPNLFEVYWDFRGRLPSSFNLLTAKARAKQSATVE